jgi:peptidoglycan hydrolase-like protein with peptidoglycan-binding domain
VLSFESESKGVMKRIAFVFVFLVIFVMLFSGFAFAAVSSGNDSITINLQEMTVDELLVLQSDIQKVLADKGYVKYEELDRGSKGDAVSDVQERLKELGYYSGSLTGKYDSETQKAFKQFEKNNDLISDGKASQDDLVVLFSSAAAVKVTPEPVSEDKQTKRDAEEEPTGYLPFSDFDYTEFFRYPENHYGTKIVLKGKVVQVLGSRSRGYQIRLATAGSSDIVYVRVNSDPGFNVLEGDRLTVYAVMKNPYTYTSTFLNSVTIPSADADSIKLN